MSYNPQNSNGQAAMANSAPVVIASDQSALPMSAANLPLPTGAASAADQTNGSQKTQIVDGSGNTIGSTSNALNVNIAGGAVSGSENITQLGGNTLITAGVNGTLAAGGNQAAGSTVSTNTNPLLVAGSDYGTTAKLQSLKIDSSGNAQVAVTNSPTVTANIGTTNGIALNTSVIGLQVAQGSTTTGQNGSLVQGAVTTTAPTYTTSQTSPLSLDTNGNLRVTSSSSGTQNVNTTQIAGSTVATAAAGVQKVGLTDGSGNSISSTSGALNVSVQSSNGSTGATTDEASWTAGTSTLIPNGGVYNDSAAVLISGQQGTTRLTSNRGQHVNLRSSAGTEIGTTSNPVQISLANTATNSVAVKVDGSGVTQPVSGTVSVNAIPTGTNSIGTVGLNAGTSNIGGVELIDAGGTNKLSVNASGQASVTASGGDLTSGSQTAKLTDGTNTANVGLGDTSNGFLYTGAARSSNAFSVTAAGAVGASTTWDAGNYRWVSIQFTSVGTANTIFFQSSNDGVNYTFTTVVGAGSTTALGVTQILSSAGTGIWHGPITGRYFRLYVNVYGSGTIAGTIIYSSQPAALNTLGVLAGQSGTWTVQPGNTANTTPWIASLQPATAGGWSPSSAVPTTGLTNTIITAKSSAGQVGGYTFYNPNAAVSYVQIFNLASGSITLGTTAATMIVAVPAGAATNIEFTNGVAFSTAINYAATSSLSSNTAPASSLTGFLLYK